MMQFKVFRHDTNEIIWAGQAPSFADAKAYAWEATRCDAWLDTLAEYDQTGTLPIGEVKAQDGEDSHGHVRDLDQEVVSGLVRTFREGWGAVPPILIDAEGRLVAGRHRLTAAKEAGLATVRVTVVEDRQGGATRIRENLVRSELNFADLVKGLAALIPQHRDAVIRESGKSQAWQSKVKTILKAFRSGQLSDEQLSSGIEACYALVKGSKPEKGKAEESEKVEKAKTEKADKAEKVEVAEKAGEHEKAKAKAEKAKAEKGEGGDKTDGRPVWALYTAEDAETFVADLRRHGVPETFLIAWGLVAELDTHRRTTKPGRVCLPGFLFS